MTISTLARSPGLSALSRALRGVGGRIAAGVLLAAAGAVILMGIITAEALYDATYTTRDNEISDLGATRPPDSVSYQPSSALFNATMILSGLAIIAGAACFGSANQPRRAVVPVLLLGIGVLGVGLFPGNRDPLHPLFAMLAFVAGGVAAVLVGTAQPQPFRTVSIVLGATTLSVLAFAIAGSSTALYGELGDGGVERWVAYPVVLWLAVFGGYLLADSAPPRAAAA